MKELLIIGCVVLAGCGFVKLLHQLPEMVSQTEHDVRAVQERTAQLRLEQDARMEKWIVEDFNR
jgi:hypothetical protein